MESFRSSDYTKQILGEPCSVTTDGTAVVYDYGTYRFCFNSAGYFIRLDIYGEGFKLNEAVGIGSTVEQVKAFYHGKPVTETREQGYGIRTGKYAVRFKDKEYYVRFEVDERGYIVLICIYERLI